MSTIKVDTYLTRGGASEIAIDKLKGASSAGSMTVVGEGGSTTTNLQQGLAKAWVQTPSGGTPADSFNISGVTDNSAGNYTVAIANDMANDDYSVTISKIVAGSNRDANAESVATTNFIILSTAASAVEDQTCFGTIHGDLA